MSNFLDEDGNNVEYYYSQRRSMDDLSVPASQPEEEEDSEGEGEGDVSFEYSDNARDAAGDEPNAGVPS